MNSIYAIVIIGRISSGKTTLAKSISEYYSIPIASFGNYLKSYCLSHNIPLSRQNLQDIGEQFINEKPKEFLLEVIKPCLINSNHIILEGIRHKVIFDMINELFYSSLSLFVDTPESIRLQRYLDRNKDIDNIKNEAEFTNVNIHPVELEIQSLKEKCDLIVESQIDEVLKGRLDNFLPDLKNSN